MRHLDLTPFYRSTVGFDRLFDLLDSAAGFDADGVTYPPYNIERLGGNEYRITMAVAGFGEDELKIDVKEQSLTVRGEKKADESSGSSCTAASPGAASSGASSSPTTSR